MSSDSDIPVLSPRDFSTENDVRWCPGCGDYSILANMKKFLPGIGVPKENVVFISGIGCSSRFPYYMNTYGLHSIHGRAPTIASGLKLTRPELQVFVVTGDGDALSIGGNHLLHAMRRNIDINIILFNNRIYGLTKGQYSPTSELGKRTKSSPFGSIDYPINPISVALSAEATFIARTIDVWGNHLQETLRRAAKHKGVSFIEVYQNCVIFNNNTWAFATDRKVREENILQLNHGEPMIYGKDNDKGIYLDRLKLSPRIVRIGEGGFTKEDLLVHDEKNPNPSMAFFLSRMHYPDYPEPIGVFRAIKKPTYDFMLQDQINLAQKDKKHSVQDLLNKGETWEVT
ncbi:MAG: 2-oxoacid:ferredoxin oxidoreductase subunit beta [Candidatus Hodarchaeales archaeon]|jgi:2-oxoglutarate ferredoxin oxidoreductase subunit beta